MKFNPLTRELYTDKDELVKTLYCPFKMGWEDFESVSSNIRKCVTCDNEIVDTENLGDDTLLKIVRQNPNICLKVDLNQKNVNIISNGSIEQR